MKTVLMLGILCTIGAAIAGRPPQLSYTKDIKPLFGKRCLSCHNALRSFGKLDLSTYEAAMKGGEHGKVIKPKNAAGSLLVKMVKGTAKPMMPKGGAPLSQAEIKKISDWIQSGAKK